jgi:hypothetical protein
MSTAPSEQELRQCQNCHAPLRAGDLFCGACGQKYKPGRVTLWQLLQEFFSSLFNFDSRFFKTIGGLLLPGKLTVDFFLGKRQPYLHPVRLFFFTALVHFALLGVALSGLEDFVANQLEDQKRSVHRKEFLAELDSLSNALKMASPSRELGAGMDTLYTQLAASSQGGDTLYLGFLDVQKGNSEVRSMSSVDVFTLTPDALLDKYEVKGAVNRFQVRQELRILQKGDRFVAFMLGNLIWLVALMMPVLAFLLKTLYLRRDKYFVEHLVFSFHYHAFAFMAFSVPLLMSTDAGFFNPSSDVQSGEGGSDLVGIVFLVVMGYLFLAMRKFYGQGLRKTFLKFSVLNVAYLFIFCVSLVLTLTVGMLLF